MRTIRVGQRASPIITAEDDHSYLRQELFGSLEAVDVTIWESWLNGGLTTECGNKVEMLMRERLKGKKVTVRFARGIPAFVASWRAT